MALTQEQRTTQLENRVLKIELRMNEIITAINKLVSLEQLQAIAVILETDIDDLRTSLDTHEERITLLEIE